MTLSMCIIIPLWTPFFHDLQVSKRTLNSCLTPIYTLPLWITLLLLPSPRVVATSMEFFRPLCHLLFLPVPSAMLLLLLLVEELLWCCICRHKQIKCKSFSITNVCPRYKSATWFQVPGVYLPCLWFHLAMCWKILWSFPTVLSPASTPVVIAHSMLLP